jgi:hypothetical protein
MKLSNIILIIFAMSLLSSCREDKIVFPEEPVDAAIHINSYPAGASIFVREQFMNKITPAWIDNLTPGSYRVTLKYDGFVDTTKYIRLTESQKEYVFFQLREEE